MRASLTAFLTGIMMLVTISVTHAENLDVKLELHDLGVLVVIEAGEQAPAITSMRISWLRKGDQRPADLQLPKGKLKAILPVDLTEGESLEVRAVGVISSGGRMRIAQGTATIEGPTWTLDSVVTAETGESGEDFCTLAKIAITGEMPASIRVYDRNLVQLLGSFAPSLAEYRLAGLESGTRYEISLVPVIAEGGEHRRGRRTDLYPVCTKVAREWKLLNRGNRLNADTPLASTAWLLKPVKSFNDKEGNLVFTWPGDTLGWCMGRFDARRKRWEVRGVEGWTEDHGVPGRPIYDGLFSFRDMEFFSDGTGGLHAIAECSTSSNNMVLDIHGNLHDMRFNGDYWDQWNGGEKYGRARSNPLFNSWGGTGAGWGFDTDDSGKGLVVLTHFTLGSNKHLLADRYEPGKPTPWQLWGEKGWEELKSHTHSFLFVPRGDTDDFEHPRTVWLGDDKWLVVFRYTARGKQPKVSLTNP